MLFTRACSEGKVTEYRVWLCQLMNYAHVQERVVDTMWRMALARSFDWSIPVNVFSILGFLIHLIVFGE